jgi:hypothetical protein
VLATGCGDGDGAASKSASTTAAKGAGGITPFPTEDIFPLKTGTTYTTVKFRPALAMTVGAGEWEAAPADRPDHVAMQRVVEDGDAFLAFHHVTKVFDPRKGGVTPGDQVAGPRDFLAWLRAHPHLRTTKPIPVERLGMRGFQVDVTPRSSPARRPRDCEKVTGGHGACVALWHDGFDFAIYWVGTKSRFYVLGEPGSQLVVEEAVSPSSRFAERAKLLERQLEQVRIASS